MLCYAMLCYPPDRQAAAWKEQLGGFGIEAVLISPLKRAVQTAALAFDGEEVLSSMR